MHVSVDDQGPPVKCGSWVIVMKSQSRRHSRRLSVNQPTVISLWAFTGAGLSVAGISTSCSIPSLGSSTGQREGDRRRTTEVSEQITIDAASKTVLNPRSDLPGTRTNIQARRVGGGRLEGNIKGMIEKPKQG